MKINSEEEYNAALSRAWDLSDIGINHALADEYNALIDAIVEYEEIYYPIS